MTEPYNLTTITDQSTLIGTFQAINTLSDGLLGIMFLLLFAIIMFTLFKNYEFKRALAGSTFITSVVAMLLRVISFINDTIMFSCFLISAVAFIWLVWGD